MLLNIWSYPKHHVLKSKDEELKKIHQNHGNDITQGVR